jgi:hypothetical protein
VDAVCIEPDSEECERLRRRAADHPSPWRSLRFLPVALGLEGEAQLKIYRRAGCSSLLAPNHPFVTTMGRAEWFEPLGSRTLTLTPLDALLDDVPNSTFCARGRRSWSMSYAYASRSSSQRCMIVKRSSQI